MPANTSPNEQQAEIRVSTAEGREGGSLAPGRVGQPAVLSPSAWITTYWLVRRKKMSVKNILSLFLALSQDV